MTVVSDELRNKNYKEFIVYDVLLLMSWVSKDQREDTIDCIDYMSWVSKDARKPP